MAAYNFQSKFILPIRDGIKRHTIRPIGKRRHARVDELMQIYTGMRTKNCQKIIDDPTCTGVIPITLEFQMRSKSLMKLGDGKWKPIREHFAIADGFSSVAEMRHFFTKTYGDFRDDMLLISWGPNE